MAIPAPDLSYEAAKKQVEQLFRSALSSTSGQGLVDLFEFMKRFRRLSLWNAAMVRIQRPGAGPVGSLQQWLGIGRKVAPDAIPVIILKPYGPLQLVYEYRDTLPPMENVPGVDPFAVGGKVEEAAKQDVLENTIQGAWATDRIKVELVDYGTCQAGTAATLDTTNFGSDTTFDPSGDETEGPGKQGALYRVRIARKLTAAQQYTTLAHELGHIYCGHLGKDKTSPWPDRHGQLTRAQQELEAESVAYLVGLRAGLELPSVEYLSNYVQPEDLEAISIDRVIRAASRVEACGR